MRKAGLEPDGLPIYIRYLQKSLMLRLVLVQYDSLSIDFILDFAVV